ncbi:uncharacterized protein [Lolium perenne]|uniref:uncharacterized protein isoform X2 n=1 Tax=Lolium perenne TaxID=4522 RepID=UPI0021F67313|nr:uncharacterized protein LOC127342577 isoform X2 [Lolium perenne]
MAATAKDVRAVHVPDEVAQEEEQNGGVALNGSDGNMTAAAHTRVEEQSSGGGGAARHGDEEEVSQDGNVQTQRGFLLGRKRKAIATRSKPEATETKIHDKKCQGESLRAENEILRLQLVQTMKELEAEQIRRLELELLLKNKENKSLKKQNKALRAENEHYKKTAKPPRNPRLCRFCNEYVLGHDYRNCPERRASPSSEQDEADDSN